MTTPKYKVRQDVATKHWYVVRKILDQNSRFVWVIVAGGLPSRERAKERLEQLQRGDAL